MYFNHITAAVRHVMSYHYNVYLLCYSRHVGHSSHVQSILAIVWPILVCQDIVAGQQRILIISSDILHITVECIHSLDWITGLDYTGLDYWTHIKFVQIHFSTTNSHWPYDHYFVYHTLRVLSVLSYILEAHIVNCILVLVVYLILS